MTLRKLGDVLIERRVRVGTADGDGLPLLGVSNTAGLHRTTKPRIADLSRYQRVERDWFAYNPMRINVGSLGWASDDDLTGIISPDYVVFSCGPDIDPAYLHFFLRSAAGAAAIRQHTAGSVRERLYFASLSMIPIQLPSMAEQRRRVQTLSEFFGSMDAFLNHCSRLLKTDIPQLRQTILQLAVTGRLVEQDEGDEPAEKLLQRIEAERCRQVSAGLIPDYSGDSPESPADPPPQIPQEWQWRSLNWLISLMDSGWSPNCPDGPTTKTEQWGVLRTTAVQPMRFDESEHKALPSGLKPRPKCEVQKGDILITRAGPKQRVGICCLVARTRPRLMISDKILRFHLIGEELDPEFVVLCLNAGYSRDFLEAQKTGMAVSQMNIPQSKLRMTPIPVAPIRQQRETVAAVRRLMMCCDTLEAQLTARQGTAERLTAAMVQAVLDGAGHEPAAEPMPRDPQQDRAAIAARIVQHLHERPHFGSVHFAKVFYTAVTHTGLDLGITFQRQKAGPLWTGLYPLRNAGQRDGWLRYTKAAGDGEPDRYQPGPQIAPLLQYGEHLLAGRAADFDRILDLFSALDTRRAELIATAYAVWNDFLLAGETPSDARIVKDFRENWHSEKAKFPAAEIRQGLAWLRENGLTPTGRGTATTPQ